MIGNLHYTLVHAVTEYDRKQENRRGYNRYALPQYLGAIDSIEQEIAEGRTVRQAIISCLNGRLADACLRAVGEPVMTKQEAR